MIPNGYKTYALAGCCATFGALAATDWVSFFNDPKAGMSIVAMSVLMSVMRALTQVTTIKQAELSEPTVEKIRQLLSESQQ